MGKFIGWLPSVKRCRGQLLSQFRHVLVITVLLVGLTLAGRVTANTSPVSKAASNSNSDLASDCVILLHGLARTKGAMQPLAKALQQAGYQVVNQGYDSRKQPVRKLADTAIPQALNQCGATTTHFVTHSMGGILLRAYLQEHTIHQLGRAVMLGPPNQGSEVVDKLANVPGFKLLNGPAGLSLGTTESSIPRQLEPVPAGLELGVIAGNHTINLILSQLLPKPNDGKVSVQSTKIEGMQDHLVLPVTHTFMMRDDEVKRQVLVFLRQGSFDKP